jgi:predicted alpha/beta-hydrolase family hydrolase
MLSIRRNLTGLVWLSLMLAACGTPTTPAPSATPLDPPTAQATSTAELTATIDLGLTPTVPAGTATATVSPAPSDTPLPSATPVEAGRPVTIPVAEGVSLSGTLYGQGNVAVIFSNMGDQHQATWATVAREFSAAGYLAVTYEFRYWVNNRMDEDQLQFIGEDLHGVVSYVRELGAEAVVLIGASLGGMATAMVAAETDASAVVIMAAPMQAPGVDVAVSVEALQAIAAPKLFITSEFDDTVAPRELEAMYDQAVEPKELFVYAGQSAHGTQLLGTDQAADLRARLLAFVSTHAASEP